MTTPDAMRKLLAARRSLRYRRLKAAGPILPCRICGEQPEVDLGLLGDEFARGEESVCCATIFMMPGWIEHSLNFHHGVPAWNATQKQAP